MGGPKEEDAFAVRRGFNTELSRAGQVIGEERKGTYHLERSRHL